MLASTSNILSYKDFLKDTSEPLQIRLAIAKRFKETNNISLVSKEFQITRNTIRKRINRFNRAISSFRNHSKAPKEPHCDILINKQRN